MQNRSITTGDGDDTICISTKYSGGNVFIMIAVILFVIISD